ncbi:MAG TPA: hypothetical protein VF719_09145, partial [Abditibacteriaceae bacterium]
EKSSEKRARRDAAAREKLRELMTPSDELMRRLARAGAITSTGASFEDDETAVRRMNKAPRRSRRWESRCGKCGVNTTFSTIAGLCSRCGAIAVRND